MSGRPDIDRVLESWLADGPTQLPDRAIEAIVKQTTDNDQRGLLWPSGGTRMNRMLLAVGGIAAVIALVAVGLAVYGGVPGGRTGVGAPQPTVTPTASPTEVNGVLFTSERHGYELLLPDATWTVDELPGEWPLGDSFNQDGPGADSVANEGVETGLILINSQAVPAGTSLDEWATDYQSANRRWFGCAIEKSETTVVDGETARAESYLCGGPERAAEALTLHGGRAYVIRVFASPNDIDADVRPILDDFVSRFHFTD